MKIVPSLFVCALSITTAFANDFPRFQVDASWPKPLPNNWIMGQAAGVAVDAQDNVWVIQRPRTLTDDEKAATFNPPRTKCCVPAPPVMQFDPEGNLLKAWGGPGQGYDWFENEHGINIDYKGFVWVGGNGNNDGTGGGDSAAGLTDPVVKCGSILECENQILGERLPVTGTCGRETSSRCSPAHRSTARPGSSRSAARTDS